MKSIIEELELRGGVQAYIQGSRSGLGPQICISFDGRFGQSTFWLTHDEAEALAVLIKKVIKESENAEATATSH